MANTLAEVTPKLLAMGLDALREYAIMPMLVNRGYEPMAGERGSTIDIPVPSAIAATEVTPANVPPSTADTAPTSVSIELDQWYESAFYLTDKDYLTIAAGTIPMQVSEAMKSLANQVDSHILGKCSKFFGVYGTPNTTPFSGGTVTPATQARKVLENQLCPKSPRWMVLNPDAEAEALELRNFHDASFTTTGEAILDGEITRRFGFNFVSDQNVTSHTAGTGTGFQTNNASGYAAGVKTIAIDTGSGTLLVGDLITFANHDQTYVVTEGTSGAGSISFEPGLVVAVGDNVALTSPGDTGGYSTHVINPVFHRDALALATRPLMGSQLTTVLSEVVVDPVSQLTFRLEVTREHKRDRFSYDILWGAECVRRELGMRLIG